MDMTCLKCNTLNIISSINSIPCESVIGPSLCSTIGKLRCLNTYVKWHRCNQPSEICKLLGYRTSSIQTLKPVMLYAYKVEALILFWQ